MCTCNLPDDVYALSLWAFSIHRQANPLCPCYNHYIHANEIIFGHYTVPLKITLHLLVSILNHDNYGTVDNRENSGMHNITGGYIFEHNG